MTRHFLTLMDLGFEGLVELLYRADELKKMRGRPDHPRSLVGKSIALILEKASTRTRVSFEVGIYELGGLTIVLAGQDSQLGRGEPPEDTARVLSRYVHGIVYRTFGHERIESLARAASVPVINALTDIYHPCQVLADLMTIRENRRSGLQKLRVAWVGDGNNMAHSWILASALAGFELRLACPAGYRPAQEVLDTASSRGRGTIIMTEDADQAVCGAHVVTTDVWASMGQEEEKAARRQAFADYCVTAERMAMADPSAIFLHCLPAHRGEEVDAEVIDGPSSRVWDQAENRLHVQKALLRMLCSS